MTFVWSTKLAHEHKSFSSPPLNVWFRVPVQQITWYRSRSTYWLLIEWSIKAHWLMTLYGLNWKWYGRRFLSNECAAFTLLFPFENRRARERSERASEREPLALLVNISPAAFIFIPKIDDLQRENRWTISNEKVEGLWTGYEGACYYFSELYKRSQVIMLTSWKVYFREGGEDGWVGWHWVLH